MADEQLPIYLYGSSSEVLHDLSAALVRMFPGLRIAGAEPSKFRLSQPKEDAQIADQITGSGARMVLVGLGCPRQELFVHAMGSLLDMPLLAVGATFDYHAGRLRRAPLWMQRRGLAWLFRLIVEPRRLWRRYLVLNPAYLVLIALQRLRLWRPVPASPLREHGGSFPV
jgi:exopolysaccharide biosynthesis WecB/TagA/CpsF family protein